MSDITYLEEYVKEKNFTEQVIPFFTMLHTPYEQLVEDTTALFSLPYKSDYLYVFLEYIPRNVHTEKPNITDRFFNIKSNPRQSTGEWVVHKIFTIGSWYHNELSQQVNLPSTQTPVIATLLAEIQK